MSRKVRSLPWLASLHQQACLSLVSTSAVAVVKRLALVWKLAAGPGQLGSWGPHRGGSAALLPRESPSI